MISIYLSIYLFIFSTKHFVNSFVIFSKNSTLLLSVPGITCFIRNRFLGISYNSMLVSNNMFDICVLFNKAIYTITVLTLFVIN